MGIQIRDFYTRTLDLNIPIRDLEVQIRDLEAHVPRTEYRVPGTRYRVPATKYQVPSTRYQVPSTRYQVPGTRLRGAWPHPNPCQFREVEGIALITRRFGGGGQQPSPPHRGSVTIISPMISDRLWLFCLSLPIVAYYCRLLEFRPHYT